MEFEFHTNQALMMIGELYVKERLASDRAQALMVENLQLQARISELHADTSFLTEAGDRDDKT